jgi:hypothetical protein
MLNLINGQSGSLKESTGITPHFTQLLGYLHSGWSKVTNPDTYSVTGSPCIAIQMAILMWNSGSRREQRCCQLIKQHLEHAQQHMKVQTDKNREFDVGDRVYLRSQPYVQSSVN